MANNKSTQVTVTQAIVSAQLNYLEKIQSYFNNPDKEALNKSLRNVHCKGLFSLVINGSEHGKLTRVFIATKKIKPMQIQLHSHRYGITLTPLKGVVMEHTFNNAVGSGCFTSSLFDYKSPLNDGKGLEYIDDVKGFVSSQYLPIGCSTQMNGNNIHTVSCSKGSIWIVEEKGFNQDSSLVIGTPFITKNLYKEPKQFEINDNFQLVKTELNTIINSYKNL